jgi:hypothetical protein
MNNARLIRAIRVIRGSLLCPFVFGAPFVRIAEQLLYLICTDKLLDPTGRRRFMRRLSILLPLLVFFFLLNFTPQSVAAQGKLKSSVLARTRMTPN